MRAGSGREVFFSTAASVLVHAFFVAALLFVRSEPAASNTIQYQVFMVAGPQGPRQAGVVQSQPPPVEQQPARKESAPQDLRPKETTKVPTKKAPERQSVRATPTNAPQVAKSMAVKADSTQTSKAADVPPPVAGSGSAGGTGTDVTNIILNGLKFPDQPYLENVIRRVMENFEPPKGANWSADVSFDIGRNGCIRNLKMVRRSPNSEFNARAVEAVSRAGFQCGFKALPEVWTNDILPILFTFDPRYIR